MQERERLAHLELALTPQVGAMTFLKLLQAFPNVQDIWQTSAAALSQIVSSKAATAIHEHQGLSHLQAACMKKPDIHRHRVRIGA